MLQGAVCDNSNWRTSWPHRTPTMGFLYFLGKYKDPMVAPRELSLHGAHWTLPFQERSPVSWQKGEWAGIRWKRQTHLSGRSCTTSRWRTKQKGKATRP